MASSLEGNKIAAAILTAGIIASGSGVLSSILYHPKVIDDPVYMVEVEEDAGGEGGEETQPLPVLLAQGDAAHGESVAKQCSACHSFEEGGANQVGPNLWDIVGRDIASVEGFNYSDALSGKEGDWTFQDLSAFIANPREWASGTNMSYAGLSDPQDRADLLLYLRSLAEDPVALPEPEQTVAEGEGGEGAQDGGAAGSKGGEASAVTMIASADPAAGENLIKQCAACHSFEEGGSHGIGPNLWNVVQRDIGGVEDYSYSDALASHDGAWTYEHLNNFLENPREWAPGTKMSYAGVKDKEDRASIIAYLRSLAPDPAPLPGEG